MTFKHKKNLIALMGCFLFSLTMNTQAQLTVIDGGLGVYDSGINATWTQDANLLGTMESNPTAYGYTNSSSLISAIINSNGGTNGIGGVIHDTPNAFDNGTYTLTAADFGSGGKVDWWAGQAYVHYLNSLNSGAGYGGSTQWALPTQPDQNSGWNITNSQFGELYYKELGGKGNSSIIPSGPFSNVQSYVYWSGTEITSDPNGAWIFLTRNGFSGGQGTTLKSSQSYVWAVSPGQVSSVPAPGAIWLFGSALTGFIGFMRKKKPMQ